MRNKQADERPSDVTVDLDVTDPSFLGADWTYVPMATYLGMDELERSVRIPERSGLYVWLYDFTPLLAQSCEDSADKIRIFLSERGRRSVREDLGAAVEWQAARPAMPPPRRLALGQLLESASPVAVAVAQSATAFQRPLYVGITSNLRRRTDEHLESSRDLASRVTKFAMRNCCLSWLELPAEFCLGTSREPLPEGEASADTDEDATHQEFLSVAERDRNSLSDAARAVESLLIRTMQPYFNVSTDS